MIRFSFFWALRVACVLFLDCGLIIQKKAELLGLNEVRGSQPVPVRGNASPAREEGRQVLPGVALGRAPARRAGRARHVR